MQRHQQNVMKIQAKKRGRPKKSSSWTAKQLNDSAVYYFDKCDARTRTKVVKDGVVTIKDPAPYTVEGLCNHLGITTVTFRDWCRRTDSLGEKARMLRQRIAENRVTGALDGRQNASFARFMLTNNHADDYRERVEVENSVGEEAKSMFDEWRRLWKAMSK